MRSESNKRVDGKGEVVKFLIQLVVITIMLLICAFGVMWFTNRVLEGAYRISFFQAAYILIVMNIISTYNSGVRNVLKED